MESNIRQIAPPDVPAVVEFALRAWAPVFESFQAVLGERLFKAVYPDWLESQARDVEAVCRDDSADVWVAQEEGRPVAYVAIRLDPDAKSGEIDMLAVDPEFQRRGIGSALTTFALERIRDAGCMLAVVATGGDPGHASARLTYEKAGFVGLPLVRYYMLLDGDDTR
ncbi:MAG TPA: GNAT family N-acetyltransferase [Candidatus Dormibacteraeota bacterium]|jgi:ribosomal protein S18 acetylase RimI-like enzyme